MAMDPVVNTTAGGAANTSIFVYIGSPWATAYSMALIGTNTLLAFIWINSTTKYYVKVDINAFLASAVSGDSRIGVVQLSGRILLKGIADGFSGLTPGVWYQMNVYTGAMAAAIMANTTPTTTADNVLIGRAISATQIHVKDYLF
jgi:hypothetical protein